MQTETQKRLSSLALAASVNNTAGRTGLAFPDRKESVAGGDYLANGGAAYDPDAIEGSGGGMKKKRRKRKPKMPKMDMLDEKMEKKKRAPRKKKCAGGGLTGQGLVGGGPVVGSGKDEGFANHGVGPTPPPGAVGGGVVVDLNAGKKGSGMKRKPSAYNKFVKEFSKTHKGKDMMKQAAAAWCKQKK